VPLATRRRMWLQHDEAPSHFGIFERKLWRKVDRKRWTGDLALSVTWL
jgi:hypothetical protein